MSLRFLPWATRGIGQKLFGSSNAEGLPEAGPGEFDASVQLNAEAATRRIALLGPADVVGVRRGTITRRYPRRGTRDFSGTDFPHVEFSDPFLPWTFTPAAPSAGRLMPWLTLVVVEEREGVRLTATEERTVLEVDFPDVELPKLTEASAWAHVQLDGDATVPVSEALRTASSSLSRLIAPRRLRPGTAYIACVVPTFASGREVGLGGEPDRISVALAWLPGDESVRLPVYDSWRFSTAKVAGDFETLVRALQPSPLEPGTGVRLLDVESSGLRGLPAEEELVARVGGALVAPGEAGFGLPSRSAADAFASSMRVVLGTEDGTSQPSAPVDFAEHPDPIVAPPAYGSGAAQRGIDGSAAGDWLHQVNLTPAARVTAGLGAEVVRQNQEALMEVAWEQAAAAREANRLLNRTRLASEVGVRLAERVKELSDGSLLQLTRGAHHRLRDVKARRTIAGSVKKERLPGGMVSAAFRRRIDGGGAIRKSLRRAASSSAQVRSGTSALTAKQLKDPKWVKRLSAPIVPRGVQTRTVLETSTISASARALAGTLEVDLAKLPQRTLAVRVGRTTSSEAPPSSRGRAFKAPVGVEMARVRLSAVAAKSLAGRARAGASRTMGVLREAIDPSAALGRRLGALIKPARLLDSEPVPASLYLDPGFDQPMYEQIVALDPDLLMPGCRDLAEESVALAKVNMGFVEAFLIGANHELGREFVWREYPAPASGSWLRRFWGSNDGMDDIPRLAEWNQGSLGTHTLLREDELVAVVLKGALLRRYPSLRVRAIRASRSTGGERHPDPSVSLLPVFDGTLEEGVAFFGFRFPSGTRVPEDLIGADASDAGWYIVFEEGAGEARFGLDLDEAAEPGTLPDAWRDISWQHAGVSEGAYLELGSIGGPDGGVSLPFAPSGPNTWSETWGIDAAAMARITAQRPVRMMVHAEYLLSAMSAGGDDA